MQFNLLVNDKEQVALFVVALRGVSVSVLLVLLGRCLQRCYLTCACVICMLCFSVSSSGSSSGQRFVLPIMRAPSHVLVVLFSSAFGVLAFAGFRVFPLPPLPIGDCFSIELMVQCDGCLFWGLGCRARLVAGLWVGQAYGVFHRPGVGSLVPVPRSLSTQPPFATQALNVISVFMLWQSDEGVTNVYPCLTWQLVGSCVFLWNELAWTQIEVLWTAKQKRNKLTACPIK